MDRRWLSLLVLLAALVFAALFFLGRGGKELRPSAESPAAREKAEPAVELADPRAAPERASIERADARLPVQVAAAELPVRPDAAIRSEHETLELEVVDGASSEPVPDAEVRYLVCEEIQVRGAGHVIDRIPPSAPRVRTDANGLARLDVPRSMGVMAIALRPGFLGEGAFGPPLPGESGERRASVVLVPDWDLSVEVVDDTLHPAVEVQVACPGVAWPSRETDRKGRVLFPHAGYELTRELGHALRVSIDLPLAEEVDAIVEREPPPGEPVRLRLPPLGSVEVRVLEASGKPVEAETGVTLRVVQDGEPHERAPLSYEYPALARASTHTGVALFERVGLGLELELAAGREGAPRHARTSVHGPRFPGERVTVVLQLAFDRPVLVFRAVDEAGRPVVGELFVETCVRAHRGRSGHGSSLSTDEQGFFEVPLNPSIVEGDRQELEVSARERTLLGRLDLDRAFPFGRIEMGDLVLAPPPFMASGKVVDEARRPVSAAEIYVSALQPTANKGKPDLELLDVRATTDETGAFSLQGFVPEERVRIQLAHERLYAPPLDVAVGTTGLEMVARATGGIAGRVLVDPDVPIGYVRVRVQADGAAARGGTELPDPRERITTQRREGHFWFDRMLPGVYTLVVAIVGDVQVEIPDLVVTGGEVARDPRIQAIDLRGRLHVFHLRLVPPVPDLELTGALRYTEIGGSGPAHGFGFAGPDVEVITPLARIDVTLCAIGCRVEQFTDLAADTQVHLRPGLPVRLVLPAGLVLPGPPLFVEAMLVVEKPSPGRTERRGFDQRGELSCRAPAPGRMTVRWFLERREEGSSSCFDLTMRSEQVVTVADQEAEQRIELALTNEELAAALATR